MMEIDYDLEDVVDSAGEYPPVVYERGGKWYFVDETFSEEYGPHDTEQEAREGLARYCREFLGI